ncbi:hypothetical protein ACQY0O_005617 [Thecaphora frezii]
MNLRLLLALPLLGVAAMASRKNQVWTAQVKNGVLQYQSNFHRTGTKPYYQAICLSPQTNFGKWRIEFIHLPDYRVFYGTGAKCVNLGPTKLVPHCVQEGPCSISFSSEYGRQTLKAKWNQIA